MPKCSDIKIVPDSIDCSLRPCAIFNNLPVLKEQVIIAAFFNQLRVMGDNKLRFSGFGQRIDVLRNTLHISIVQTACRLVVQYQFLLCSQRTGDGQSLLLPTG